MRYNTQFTPRWKARRLYSDAYRDGLNHGIVLGLIIGGIAVAAISIWLGV
jgi:hypothetical protein